MVSSSVNFFSNHFLGVLLFMLVIMVPAAASKGGCYQSIFNFGDDISDTGNFIISHYPSSISNHSDNSAPNNNNNLNFTDHDVVAQHDLPYHGMTTYLNMSSGRASNGRLIIDFLTDSLGLPPLPPYLAGIVSSSSPTDYPDYSKGANFAFMGANSFDHTHFHNNTIKKNKKTGFGLQFDWFNDLLASLCSTTTTNTTTTITTTTYNNNRTTTTAPPSNTTTTTTTTVDDSCIQEYLKNSLFHIGGMGLRYSLFHIGGMGTYDYRLYDNITDLETMVVEVVEGISSLIDKLSSIGAGNFMVAGLPPIGCFPASTQNYIRHEIDDENGCVYELNWIARHHNTLLQRYLQDMREWIPSATVTYVDYYKVVEGFIHSPTEYGFTNTRDACVLSDATDDNIKKCEKPGTYVFWDEYHMTEAAYRIIASDVITGKSNTPSFSLLSSKC